MNPDSRKGSRGFKDCALNFARIEITSLRLVVACASVGSITRAAPLCNMSTMCASRRLQILEESLDLVLFYRRKSGLELTAAGRVVVDHSLRILQLMEEMVLAAQEAPQPIGKVFENSGRPTRNTGKTQASTYGVVSNSERVLRF